MLLFCEQLSVLKTDSDVIDKLQVNFKLNLYIACTSFAFVFIIFLSSASMCVGCPLIGRDQECKNIDDLRVSNNC